MLACISVITVSGVFAMTSLAGMFSLGQAAYMSISAYLTFLSLIHISMKKAKDPTDGEEVRALLENDTKNVLSSGGKFITIDPATHRPTNDLGMYIATYTEDNEIVCLVYKTTDYKGE